jgi:hypothetical protein
MVMLNDVVMMPPCQGNTRNVGSGGTANAGELTGASLCIMTHVTGNNPGTFTTRTAAQMMADWPNLQVGQSWLILLANAQGTGVLTLGAGANVSVAGTATVPVNSARWFLATVTSATTITITGLPLSHTSAA